ncbi:CBS domain-containing protein [Bacillus wiedmannii]|uniref:CBS domain-containing protein n=1 Tax=Bacillus wiedmannii TaxID=1890302 RepID=A0A2B5X9E3_9BACI|nr:CBS domain-containing protein [Bacillus wiedmannii]PDY38245.1 CBS domain-containing protein [Bacillus wiedmannii]PEJ05062.1 CBS domain-containing protein [Bacillus wiedmannii]PGA93024.1 CBS domain-containing protein [Bacillus wiedmannii]PHC68784.1 CBS domain-containing protein [Bacillus wiedmannii]
MNIAFFLTPKSELVYININSTMRQALEKLEYHRYTAIPLVNNEGEYAGTLTEGDLLWKLKNTSSLSFNNTQQVVLSEVSLHRTNEPVSINAEIEDLLSRAMEQNFVPVIDDDGIFIGIVKRRDIIQYCVQGLLFKNDSV